MKDSLTVHKNNAEECGPSPASSTNAADNG